MIQRGLCVFPKTNKTGGKMRRKETNYEKILNHIYDLIPADKKLVLIDTYDFDTGVIYDIGRAMFLKDYESETIMPKTLVPFIRVSVNKLIDEKYYSKFRDSECWHIQKLIRAMDTMGRIKYGDNYQQYCRSDKDLAVVIGKNYEDIKKKFLPKLYKYDIIRVATNDYTQTSYISINPLLAVNGGDLKSDFAKCWADIINDYGLNTERDLKRAIGRKGNENRDIQDNESTE